MTTDQYQVLGASVPPMLGRASLMRTITDHLLKPSPDHVSVVGPAYYGKSVMLRHLATSFLNGSGSYLTASHIDLRHGVPASDGEFLSRFAQEVKEAVQGARPQLAEHIEAEDEAIHEVLGLVFEKGGQLNSVPPLRVRYLPETLFRITRPNSCEVRSAAGLTTTPSRTCPPPSVVAPAVSSCSFARLNGPR